nr:Multidrug-efflux transporter [Kibdelosporangium sp. MJ126-NF4]
MFEKSSGKPILLVCLAMFGLMAGQQMVGPILPPLARELGLSELHLGIVMTVAASGAVLVSPFWGRRSTAWGHRAVLLTSLVGAAAGLLGFAVIAQAGMSGVFAVPLLFTLILLTRSIVFGIAWAATPVTAQSYVADMTSGEAARVRGMSMVGAAQGLGMALGPGVGGLLVFGGLLLPLYVAPALIAVIAVLVWLNLPKPEKHRERTVSAKVSPFDARVWPFLLSGFGMFLTYGIVMLTLGFLLQDRLGLTAKQTGLATGLVTLAGAGMMMLVQAVVVPRIGWRPGRLIQAGVIVMAVGTAVMVFAFNAVVATVALAVIGAGMGFGVPGFMSGPTLTVRRAEQGAVAGLTGSSNALTFVFGPLVGTALYEIAPAAPSLLGTALLIGLVVFVFAHPGIRQAAPPVETPQPVEVPVVD